MTPYELHLIASGLAQHEHRHAFALVDSAAGLSEQTLAFASACDLVLVVTTPDVTAMTDAYAFLKVLVARRRGAAVRIVVNRVPVESDQGPAIARHVGERLAQVARKFLGVEPELAGWIPEDPAVGRSLAARRPLVESEAGSPAAVALQALSVVLADALRERTPGGLGRGLARTVGFSTASA
jgi:flagellar biosynthesis protein FlhG